MNFAVTLYGNGPAICGIMVAGHVKNWIQGQFTRKTDFYILLLYIASFVAKGVVYGAAVVHSFQNKLPLILEYKKGNNFDGNNRSELDHEDDMAETAMTGHEYFCYSPFC